MIGGSNDPSRLLERTKKTGLELKRLYVYYFTIIL